MIILLLKNKKQELIFVNFIKKIKKFLSKNQFFLIESDYNPKKLFKFLNRLKFLNIGLNYDSGNSASLGYKLQDEKALFKYVKNIHIKDRVRNGATVDLGKGNFNFKLFKNFLKEIKYNGNLILQTARDKNGNDVEKLKKNIEYLKLI